MGRRILLGRIAGAHGVRGELRVRSFTGEPADIASYGPLEDAKGERRFALTVRGSVRGSELIARIAGIDDRNAAEALKGTELYVDRDRLPPTATDGEYYEADLVGLRVEAQDRAAIGTVRSVADFGAGPVLEIAKTGGGELYLAFTDAMVPVVDVAGGRLVVVPPIEVEVRPEDASADAGETDGVGAADRSAARAAGGRGRR